MCAQANRGGGTSGGQRPSPLSRPDHRKGRSPWQFYVGGLVVALVVVGGLLAASGVLRSLFAPGPQRPGTTTTTPSPSATTSPSAGASPSIEASVPPLPVSGLAESAAAVKAAALPFPNPPAVTPETITHTHPTRKLVAITIDDGIPFDTNILKLLEQKNVRCTTFLLGQAVKLHPDLVKRLNADGFEIANHTWDHKNLTKLTSAQIRSELTSTQEAISAITGNQAPYMRPPGGATNSRARNVAASLGYRVVLWNKSFADTSSVATPQKMFHNVMDHLQPGDIILCHWGAGKSRGEATFQALELILPAMEKEGFTPVTLSELLKYSSTAAGTTAQQGQGGLGTTESASTVGSAAEQPGVVAK